MYFSSFFSFDATILVNKDVCSENKIREYICIFRQTNKTCQYMYSAHIRVFNDPKYAYKQAFKVVTHICIIHMDE